MSKYSNKITLVDGIKFHSKLEARRYDELKLLERAGEIDCLMLQPRYELLCGDKSILIRSARYKNGRKAVYVADFRYRIIATREYVIEDTKGARTAEYILKKAIMEAMGYQITEITR